MSDKGRCGSPISSARNELARFDSLIRLQICRCPGCRTRLLSHVISRYLLSRCRRSSTIKYCMQSECALKLGRQRPGPSKCELEVRVSYRDHLHPIALKTANLVISLGSGFRAQVIKSSVLTVRMRALLSQTIRGELLHQESLRVPLSKASGGIRVYFSPLPDVREQLQSQQSPLLIESHRSRVHYGYSSANPPRTVLF
jgi:hypothetical protein